MPLSHLWADHYVAADAGWATGEFNGTATVIEADYTLWADYYGFDAAVVPEPAILLLLGLCAPVLIHVRKQSPDGSHAPRE